MTNPLDTIADKIARLIEGEEDSVFPPNDEDSGPEKLLTSGDEGIAPKSNTSFAEDLVRFLLPPFKSLQTAGNGIGQINPAGPGALHFLPRYPDKGLVIIFPQPIFGIWLDPRWTTPGALIGVGNGSTRSTYRFLTRGDGIRFTNGITQLTFFNGDGLEQITPDLPNADLFPWGYVGFLIALTPAAQYNPSLGDGVCNVSRLIQNAVALTANAPSDGFNQPNAPLVSTLSIKRFGINIVPITNTGTRAARIVGGRLFPWFCTSLPISMATLSARSAGDNFVFDPNTFGVRWVRGDPICYSARTKLTSVGDSASNDGFVFEIKAPESAVAMQLQVSAQYLQAGQQNSDATKVAVEIYGIET